MELFAYNYQLLVRVALSYEGHFTEVQQVLK